MNNNDAWNAFYKSGNIYDYLNYKQTPIVRREVFLNAAEPDAGVDKKRAKGRGKRPPGDRPN